MGCRTAQVAGASRDGRAQTRVGRHGIGAEACGVGALCGDLGGGEHERVHQHGDGERYRGQRQLPSMSLSLTKRTAQTLPRRRGGGPALRGRRGAACYAARPPVGGWGWGGKMATRDLSLSCPCDGGRRRRRPRPSGPSAGHGCLPHGHVRLTAPADDWCTSPEPGPSKLATAAGEEGGRDCIVWPWVGGPTGPQAVRGERSR